MFTSTESIMRNNPANPSSVDPFDKLPRVEKQDDGEVTVGQFEHVGPSSRFSDMSMGKPHPATPVIAPIAMPDSPVLPATVPRPTTRVRKSSLTYIIPTLHRSAPPPIPMTRMPNPI